MRTDPEEIAFSDYILKIGNGEEEILSDLGDSVIQIPENFLVYTLEELLIATFPELEVGCGNITDGCIYTHISEQGYL